jgi:hypothetical protein
MVARKDEVSFWVNCELYPQGAKANFEAFTNFNLKNGWKVKSYEILNPKTADGSWNWVVPPNNGSPNPYSKLHLWVNAGVKVSLKLKILIEGPEGTNPYQ